MMETTAKYSAPKERNWISLALRLLISIGASVYLVYRVDWGLFFSQLKDIQLAYVLMAFLAANLCIWISGYKWYILCRMSGQVSFWQCLRWYYIGFFFNNFLPGSIGGDVFRIYYAGQKLGTANSIATVTVERLFAGFALLGSAVLGLVWVNFSDSFWVELTLLALVCLVMYNLLFHPRSEQFITSRFGEKAASFYEATSRFKQEKGLLIKLLLYSFLFQLCFVWITALLYSGMGYKLSFMTQLAFVSLISALTMLPISVNGIGVREGAYAFLFALVGIEEAASVAVSLLFFVLVLLSTSLGGLFWLLEREKSITRAEVTE